MTQAEQQKIEIRAVTINDIIDVCASGLRDFIAAPMYGLVLAGMFVLAGWLIIALLFYFGLVYFAYPLAMGFALISPFAAVGFYAVSDHLERGEKLSFAGIASAIGTSISRDLRWMALVTGFGLFFWLDIAAILFFGFFGLDGLKGGFIDRLLTTPTGLLFLLVGNLAGAMIAMAIFSVSAVSFPMLYDRDIDFVTAMVTSVRLVLSSPVAMIVWCGTIAIATGLSLLSFFVGLLVVLPVIGHATWHLYRKAIVVPQGVGQPDALVDHGRA